MSAWTTSQAAEEGELVRLGFLELDADHPVDTPAQVQAEAQRFVGDQRTLEPTLLGGDVGDRVVAEQEIIVYRK